MPQALSLRTLAPRPTWPSHLCRSTPTGRLPAPMEQPATPTRPSRSATALLSVCIRLGHSRPCLLLSTAHELPNTDILPRVFSHSHNTNAPCCARDGMQVDGYPATPGKLVPFVSLNQAASCWPCAAPSRNGGCRCVPRPCAVASPLSPAHGASLQVDDWNWLKPAPAEKICGANGACGYAWDIVAKTVGLPAFKNAAPGLCGAAGQTTKFLTYNGQVPGPTIYAPV